MLTPCWSHGFKLTIALLWSIDVIEFIAQSPLKKHWLMKQISTRMHRNDFVEMTGMHAPIKNLSKKLFFSLAISLLGFLPNILAQNSPSECEKKLNCTSNDVQIQAAYLSYQDGTQLPENFVCNGSAQVYLTLELTTNTPRIGVSIYTLIKKLEGNTPTDIITSLGQCFAITLNQPTNKVTFQQPFNWNCGQAIAMTDVFISWGTGNTDFCNGTTGFKCPATSSKCYSLPPNQYIPIVTPRQNNQFYEICATSTNGMSASIDLTQFESAMTGDPLQFGFDKWYEDQAATTEIVTPGAYVVSAPGKKVYGRVCALLNSSVCTVSELDIVVHQRPVLVVTDPAAVCSPTKVDLTAAAVLAGSTYPAGATPTYWTNNTATNPLANPDMVAISNTYYIKSVNPNDDNCYDIAPVVATINQTPDAATVCVMQPSLCGPAKGSIEIKSPLGAGYMYSIDNGANYQASPQFAELAAGSVTGILVKKDNCVSAAADCSNSNCSDAQTVVQSDEIPAVLPQQKLDATKTIKPVFQTESVKTSNLEQVTISLDGGPKVIAFPNPFYRTVNFSLVSPVSGQATLQLIDGSGKTVAIPFRGYIQANHSLNTKFQMQNAAGGMLYYRFTVADKQVTGKIMALHQ